MNVGDLLLSYQTDKNRGKTIEKLKIGFEMSVDDLRSINSYYDDYLIIIKRIR